MLVVRTMNTRPIETLAPPLLLFSVRSCIVIIMDILAAAQSNATSRPWDTQEIWDLVDRLHDTRGANIANGRFIPGTFSSLMGYLAEIHPGKNRQHHEISSKFDEVSTFCLSETLG